MHKGRPLVMPMVIVSTAGYYISVLSPYFADSRNNNASILNHIISNNIEEIKNWVRQTDIFVVDRGFRDSIQSLEDFGIRAEIPAFMAKRNKQMTCEEANTSQLVTKVFQSNVEGNYQESIQSSTTRSGVWKSQNFLLAHEQVSYKNLLVRH